MEDHVNGGDVAWLGVAQTGTTQQHFIACAINTLAGLLSRLPFRRFYRAADARFGQVLPHFGGVEAQYYDAHGLNQIGIL